jgi:hypothetical protein
MDLHRRQNANAQKITVSLLENCSRIAVVADSYRQLINLLDGDIDSAKVNPFYREHIGGGGWHGVTNQNSSALGFLLRQANNSYGLRAADGNWGAIFVSARALSSLLINGSPNPSDFGQTYHCEHTVQINQRSEEMIDWILENNITDPVDIARSVLRNTVVATVLKTERNDTGNHNNTNHRPFWRYTKMDTSVLCAHPTKGMVPATNMTLADIADLQINQDPLIVGMLQCMMSTSTAVRQSMLADAKNFLYEAATEYHRLPKDLSVFARKGEWTREQLWELEDRHYTHKRHKNSYTGKR